jgi:hypothetical protein
MKLIGDQTKLAFALGGCWQDSKQHQTIEIWVDGRNFSEFENTVYLPTFYTRLKNEIARIHSQSFYREDFDGLDKAEIYKLLEERADGKFEVLCYDLTTCSARSYLVDDGKRYRVIYSFWDPRHEPQREVGSIYSMEIDKRYMLDTMQRTLDSLSTVWF